MPRKITVPTETSCTTTEQLIRFLREDDAGQQIVTEAIADFNERCHASLRAEDVWTALELAGTKEEPDVPLGLVSAFCDDVHAQTILSVEGGEQEFPLANRQTRPNRVELLMGGKLQEARVATIVQLARELLASIIQRAAGAMAARLTAAQPVKMTVQADPDAVLALIQGSSPAEICSAMDDLDAKQRRALITAILALLEREHPEAFAKGKRGPKDNKRTALLGMEVTWQSGNFIQHLSARSHGDELLVFLQKTKELLEHAQPLNMEGRFPQIQLRCRPDSMEGWLDFPPEVTAAYCDEHLSRAQRKVLLDKIAEALGEHAIEQIAEASGLSATVVSHAIKDGIGSEATFTAIFACARAKLRAAESSTGDQ